MKRDAMISQNPTFKILPYGMQVTDMPISILFCIQHFSVEVVRSLKAAGVYSLQSRSHGKTTLLLYAGYQAVDARRLLTVQNHVKRTLFKRK